MKILLLLFSFLFNISTNKQENGEQLIMIINLLRHGARSPNKFLKEMEHKFQNNIPGKLTLNGFRQMNNLGRSMRKLYIKNQLNEPSFKNFINEKNIKNEFLLISSPYDRAIESGIGYAYGFLHKNDFNIIDHSDLNRNYASKSVINELKPDLLEDINKNENIYNFIIEEKNRDILFHSKKCIFPQHIYDDTNNKNNFTFLNQTERENVFLYYKSVLNKTFANLTIDDFSEKMAKSIFTGLRCTNENVREKIFTIPLDVENILIKLFGKSLYYVRTNTEIMTKISVSPFFDHVINFFDHKFFGMDLQNKTLDFWKLKDLNYTNVKIVTYSGHDYNLIGLFKNLLHPNRLEIYLNNPEKYKKFVIFPFSTILEFRLVKNSNNGKIFVKIFVNSEEILEYVRTGEYDEKGKEGEIMYQNGVGIEYKTFRKILFSRIFPEYHQCINTINLKKKKEKR